MDLSRDWLAGPVSARFLKLYLLDIFSNETWGGIRISLLFFFVVVVVVCWGLRKVLDFPEDQTEGLQVN